MTNKMEACNVRNVASFHVFILSLTLLLTYKPKAAYGYTAEADKQQIR